MVVVCDLGRNIIAMAATYASLPCLSVFRHRRTCAKRGNNFLTDYLPERANGGLGAPSYRG